MSAASLFSTIVVPVDFSEAPEDESEVQGFIADAGTHRVAFSPSTVRAVELAAGMCQGDDTVLHLVHAVPPLVSTAMYQGPVTVPAKIIEEIHDRAEATSVAAMEALAVERAPGVKTQLSVAPANSVRYVLGRARQLNADLIVMAASGRSKVARFFVGSTADRIIREATCPVLIVPSLGPAPL